MAVQPGADAFISNNERDFINKALASNQRIDGRGPYDHRNIQFQFALDDSGCTVLLGHTRVMAVITASLEPPYPDRPSEGSLRFNIDFSPMASPAFEPGPPREDAIELARLIERGLRESRAIDLEALCVQAGRQVWHLQADITVLDHCGNLADACGLAALAALSAFRRPDVTITPGVSGNDSEVKIHTFDEKEPLPLTIHHLPVPVTFALFGPEGTLMVLDPSLKEEASSSGTMTVTVNPSGELCALQKARGVGLSMSETMRCVRLAIRTAGELTEQLKKALSAHEVARVQARVRRTTITAVTNTEHKTVSQKPATATTEEDGAVLPEAVQKAVDLANASDTPTSSEGDEKEPVQQNKKPRRQQKQPAVAAQPEEEEDMDDIVMEEGNPSLAATEEETGEETAVTNKKQRKRKKQTVDDPRFASLAAKIAAQGGGNEDVSDLADAVKKKKTPRGKGGGKGKAK